MNRFGALLLGLALAGTFVGCGDVELVGDTPLCSTTVIKKCITDKYGIPWCEVTPGSFMMGSAETEPCREQSGTKETRHKVTLTRKFQVAQYETTQTEYLERMKTNPSKYSGSDAPVERVTWHQSATSSPRTGGLRLATSAAGAIVRPAAPLPILTRAPRSISVQAIAYPPRPNGSTHTVPAKIRPIMSAATAVVTAMIVRIWRPTLTPSDTTAQI